MEIASLITGPVGVNTYIVYGKNAGECIIIDPSDTELVNKKLDELGVKPTAVLLTHGHFDHIVSVADLQKQYGARAEAQAPVTAKRQERDIRVRTRAAAAV